MRFPYLIPGVSSGIALLAVEAAESSTVRQRGYLPENRQIEKHSGKKSKSNRSGRSSEGWYSRLQNSVILFFRSR